MQYLVIGADGNEYGPVSFETLKEWATDNRVSPDSTVKDFQSGATMRASTVEGLFPKEAPIYSPPPTISSPPVPGHVTSSPVGHSKPGPVFSQSASNADIYWSIGRSIVALVFFFVLGGLGVIVAVYGLMSAVRAQQAGHKYGVVAIVISVVTLIILAIGWTLRLSTHPTP